MPPGVFCLFIKYPFIYKISILTSCDCTLSTINIFERDITLPGCKRSASQQPHHADCMSVHCSGAQLASMLNTAVHGA